jgi:uncharacterized protein YecT (DUF1311 family)
MQVHLFVVLALSASVVSAQDRLQRCLNTAMGQGAMNNCAQRELEASDTELNRVYRELQVRYKDEPDFLKKLRAAQSAWIKFRDAQLEMQFPPHPKEPYYYGSVFPMCSMLYLRQLTSDRLDTLKEWLAGSSDDDVCVGSVKSPEELGHKKAPAAR